MVYKPTYNWFILQYSIHRGYFMVYKPTFTSRLGAPSCNDYPNNYASQVHPIILHPMKTIPLTTSRNQDINHQLPTKRT